MFISTNQTIVGCFGINFSAAVSTLLVWNKKTEWEIKQIGSFLTKLCLDTLPKCLEFTELLWYHKLQVLQNKKRFRCTSLHSFSFQNLLFSWKGLKYLLCKQRAFKKISKNSKKFQKNFQVLCCCFPHHLYRYGFFSCCVQIKTCDRKPKSCPSPKLSQWT